MITDTELFDRFVGGQVSTQEIAAMDFATLWCQVVGELRGYPDDDLFYLDSHTIAKRIHSYAKADCAE